MVFDMFCISRSRAGCKKNALKNIMIFFKSGSQYNYYYMRANYKSRYLKTTLGTFFEKTIQARGLKLGSYVTLMSFFKLISEIFL